ncbi:MAG TPA: hypothetical protein VMT76_09550 [Puia sp.]|nr:hypothetical protein [Puia sp.]
MKKASDVNYATDILQVAQKMLMKPRIGERRKCTGEISKLTIVIAFE